MATLEQIKDRIINKYQSLPTQEEKLRFLYEVQERLRNVHNTQGQRFENNEITQEQWNNFRNRWRQVNERVTDRIAALREKVFTEDFSLSVPLPQDEAATSAWSAKREQLKSGLSFKDDIDTIWQ